MPKPTWMKDDSDIGGSIIERVLGREGKQRSTKTFIPSTKLLNRLSVLCDYADALFIRFRTMHEQRTGVKLTDEQICQTYSGTARYYGLRVAIEDRLSSYKGFSLKMVFGRSDTPEAVPEKKESSAGAEPARPAPAPAAEPGMKMR